jgi:lysozyme
MQVGQKGKALIEAFEGCVLKPYKDIAGLWTIGIGHLIKPSETFTSITRKDAEFLLAADLKEAENAVDELVTVPLNQNQFDALVSFTFNLGAERLRTSTLLRKLNAGDYGAAADEFLRWSKSKGVVVAGLKRRRAAERSLFCET